MTKVYTESIIRFINSLYYWCDLTLFMIWDFLVRDDSNLKILIKNYFIVSHYWIIYGMWSILL